MLFKKITAGTAIANNFSNVQKINNYVSIYNRNYFGN